MNLDFLERQAQKNDATLQSLTQTFNEQRYSDKFPTVAITLDLAVDTVLTSIFYVHSSFVPKLVLGNIGGGLFATSIIYKSTTDYRRRKNLKQAFLDINQRIAWLNQQVEDLYFKVKAGDPDACQALSQLTGEEALKEVEETFQVTTPAK